MKTNLYYFAIQFPTAINQSVTLIKEEFAERYNAKYALKNEAHITLCPPFKADTALAESLKRGVSKLARTQEPFELTLNGYGAFAPKVIYIKVEEEIRLKQLYFNLKRFLLKYYPFEKYHFSTSFNPHVTVANKDLTQANYDTAILEFSTRAFSAQCPIAEFLMLKHNGESWKVNAVFPLSSSNQTIQAALF